MRRASVIEKEARQISTIEDLTGVFESIASTQIAKIRDKVAMSKEFFQLLWVRYSAIRIDPRTRIAYRGDGGTNGRAVFIVISGNAGLSGDIDERLIEDMLQKYDAKTTDVIVLGSHGAEQLRQRGIHYVRDFVVPESDTYIDVSPIIAAIRPYASVKVFYEEYISLGVQGIKSIDLLSKIKEIGDETDDNQDIMTANDTIFEPSLEEIADIMEETMLKLAFSQAIMESNLAQNASRFNAMAVAKKLALEMLLIHQLEFHRSKRSDSDRRLREIMISLKKKKRLKERR